MKLSLRHRRGKKDRYVLKLSAYEALVLTAVLACVNTKTIRGKTAGKMALDLSKVLEKGGWDWVGDCAIGTVGEVSFAESQEYRGAN